MIDLKDLNPVPRDLSTGWSASAEGTATRARAEWDSRTEERRRPRRMWAAAVAATVVLALVVSVVVLQSGSQQSARPASRSVVERLAHGRWTALPPLPRGQDVDAMIWTGRELIVWGADRGVEFVGGVWRPLPDWSFGNRSGAIVSWTGREMVVLGGSDPRADVKPIYGAAYNPRTRAWRRLPDSPVPFTSPSTATWTGRALVVMQGLGRAAAYDPTTDRWRALPQPPLSLPGNPTVRAAWDGRRLVVTLNAGNGPIAGAYDPATNTWNDLPAPPATGQSVATGLFRSSNGVVQVSWYTQPFIDGYLRAAALRLSWQAISNPLRHRSICKTDVTPVRNGAVVFCNTRDLIGIDARSGRWYRLPRPPDGGVTTVAWAGNSLVAVTNDGRIVRLLLGARNI